MARIVALSGTDSGCGCGMGDAASPAGPVVVTDPKMSPLTIGIWIAALGTVGYIFYATLQPVKRRKRAA
jgi:hypothetical protein